MLWKASGMGKKALGSFKWSKIPPKIGKGKNKLERSWAAWLIRDNKGEGMTAASLGSS